MGRRSATETMAGIYQRFLERSVWPQKELADVLGVTTKTLRRCLQELCREGLPLQREAAGRAKVTWRMAEGWFPGAVQWTAREVATLLPVLLQAPSSQARDAAIDRVLQAVPRERVPPRTREVVEPMPRSSTEREHEALVLAAAMLRQCLFVRYYSASRGTVSARVVSVQRVMSGSPVRLVVWCHERRELLWFVLENVRTARVDRAERFHEVDPLEVERFLCESVDGFRQTNVVPCVFAVRDPEARWARHNLPPTREGQYEVEEIDEGIRVKIVTAGVIPLARWLVGLGAAGRAESPKLAELVRQFAMGALHDGRSNEHKG
jgi:predicted DNA-binding transcriptional regulator YafY